MTDQTPAAQTSDARTDLPERVVVDQHGHYWRDYGGYWSMPSVSRENVETEIVATYVRSEAAAPPAVVVEPSGSTHAPAGLDWTRVANAVRRAIPAVEAERPTDFTNWLGYEGTIAAAMAGELFENYLAAAYADGEPE